MPIRETDPPEQLYRIGRAPDPLAWPRPRSTRGNRRFDDPRGEFRVLYAGAGRRVCFLETLAPARPSLTLLARLQQINVGRAGYDAPRIQTIPDDFLGRMMGTFAAEAGQRWFDFRVAETLQTLREEYPDLILAHGYEEFDASHALGADRNLTQSIARLAYEAGFDGIAYKSRIDPGLDCWALFDRCRIEPRGIDLIADDDPDFVAVATLFGLRVR